MPTPFDTLRKILQNESSRGYDNKGMIGGLDKYAPVLEQQARAAGADPALLDEIIGLMKNYGSLAPENRPDAVKALLAQLPQPAPPPIRTAPRTQEREREKVLPATPVGITEKKAEPPTPVSAPSPAPRPRPESRPAPRPPRRPSTAPIKRPPLPPEPTGVGLDAPLTVLQGIGPKQAENLSRLGLQTLRDTLTFFPRRYVDYSHLKTINRLEYGEEVTIIANVQNTFLRRIKGGQSSMVQTVLEDGTGEIQVTWFNQPWLREKLVAGKQVQVSGRVDQYLGHLTLRSPEWETLDRESLNTGRIVPVYPLTQGITPNTMRRWMYEAVGYTAPRVADPLPQDIRARAALMPYAEALLQIHFPDNQELLTAARKRIAFDELLLMQLGIRRQRADWQSAAGQPLVAADGSLEALIASLPYALTNAQQRALADIRSDVAKSVPMNRLLQGDVGSGKTVVAALTMAIAIQSGAQAALMAPTSILAEQHYRTIKSQIPNPKFQIALLLGATADSEKQIIYDGLRAGSIHVVIGTHALIQDRVEFANLGLVVMDEQHRFGVAQRAKLRSKGAAGAPHVLVMTATPIPRTLALTIYGDLDLSVIDEMPPGRLPVDTRIIYVNERERAYAFLRTQHQQGRQSFIICPLVEESDKIEAKAAVEEHARLQKQVFPDLRLGLLHGRMKPEEKDAAMADFRDGKTDILVSTSVVEVGVDVPNASAVLIEGANRFGLAQLHQFRGRVGRSQHQSYCLLASDLGASGDGDLRLKAMESTHDGFVLAERDLELRGPGEFLGTAQAGYGELRMAKLTDVPLIDLARREAESLFAADPTLAKPEHALLSEKMSDFWKAFEGAGDVS